jgi:hypothetical protein
VLGVLCSRVLHLYVFKFIVLVHDEDAILYQFMKVFNESSAADNPIAGLASKYLFIDM